ncbi:hypothetical protein FVE85_1834 [Porphyridium purpureum]|uniref:Uncharacterized protein n=1 Tax=Porphyridium purpureum TaxID=35688 RepID=A0A5J4YVY0_PORPP|nr:hypothetical protein FVE85_1834 [Porphyridium purpureum]|eukprot:POR3946..scf209_3
MSKLLRRIKTGRAKSSSAGQKVYFSPTGDVDLDHAREGSVELSSSDGTRVHFSSPENPSLAPRARSSVGVKGELSMAPRAQSAPGTNGELDFSHPGTREPAGTPEKRKSTRFSTRLKDMANRSSASSSNSSRAGSHRGMDTSLNLSNSDLDALREEELLLDRLEAATGSLNALADANGQKKSAHRDAPSRPDGQDSQSSVVEVLDFSKPQVRLQIDPESTSADSPLASADGPGDHVFRFAAIKGGTMVTPKSTRTSQAPSFKTARTNPSNSNLCVGDDDDDDDWVPAEMLDDREDASTDPTPKSRTISAQSYTDVPTSAQPACPESFDLAPAAVLDLKMLLLLSVESDYISRLQQNDLADAERLFTEQKLNDARSSIKALGSR